MADDYYQDYDLNGSLNGSYDYDYEQHAVCDKQSVRSFAAVFLPLVYSLTLVLGVAGNSLVVLVYGSGGGRRLRTLTDICLLNLAAADLLLLVTLPLWAAAAAHAHGWRLGTGLCKLTSFLYSATFSCSMFLLACISMDRFCSASRTGGAGCRRCVRGRGARALVSVGVWASACLLGLPELLFSHVRPTSHGLACVTAMPRGMPRPAKVGLEVLEVGLRFLLPLCIMGVCYGRVWRVLSRAAGVRRDRKWRALRVLLAVVFVFLLTQLPYNVVKLTRALDSAYALVTVCEVSKGLDHAMQVTESLALSHACVNPLLYAFLGSSFRGRVLSVAKSLGERLGAGGARPRGCQGPAVEMSLRSADRAPSLSGSEEEEEEDTSVFTM